MKRTCRYNPHAIKYYIISYGSSHQTNFANLKRLINVSPIIAKITLYNDSLLYNDGIYTPNVTSGVYINEYYVLIVGYTSIDGIDCYICKCSFGTLFGIDGYLFLNATTKINQIWKVK
jgi:C1A family cysteine protease